MPPVRAAVLLVAALCANPVLSAGPSPGAPSRFDILVVNPDFDAGMTGWTPMGDPVGTIGWDASHGSPAAGSAGFYLGNPLGEELDIGVQQCVSIGGGALYALSGRFQQGVATSQNGGPYLYVLFYDNTTCAGTALDFADARPGPVVVGASGDFVEHSTLVARAPPATIRGLIVARVDAEGPGVVQGWWDHLQLQLSPLILADGFE